MFTPDGHLIGILIANVNDMVTILSLSSEILDFIYGAIDNSIEVKEQVLNAIS